MRLNRSALAALLAWIAACAALCVAHAAVADTLLVVRKSADAVDFIDPGSGLRLASVAVGRAPHEIAVSPDGRLAAVSNYGTSEEPGFTVSIVDLAEPREVRRIELAPHTRPHGLAWYAPDRLAVTTEGSRALLVVDPLAGRIVGATPTGQDGSHMVAVGPGATTAYVANLGSGSLTSIGLTNSGVDLPRRVETGAGTEGVAVSPSGTEVWSTARQQGQVTVMAAPTLAMLARLPLPGMPIRVVFAPDGRTAYVTCAASAEVVAIDVATRTVRTRRTLDVPLAEDAASRPYASLARNSALPVGLAVQRDGRRVFVAATMSDGVVELDARTLEPVRVTKVGGEPDGLALTPVVPKARCHACEAPAAAQHDDPHGTSDLLPHGRDRVRFSSRAREPRTEWMSIHDRRRDTARGENRFPK